MHALGSICRTTTLSLMFVVGALGVACESSDDKEKTELGEESNTDVKSAEVKADWCGVRTTLQASCTTCHNPQKVAGAPMSLLTYADLQKPAVTDKNRKVYELVKERVHDDMRPMPPQKRLSDEELAGIDAWVDSGAAAGDDVTCGQDEPAQVTSATGFDWPQNCDETIRITSHSENAEDAPFMVAPGVEVHPQVLSDAPWGKESVQAIAWRPITDNARVLHHWILYGENRQFLIGWAPGNGGQLLEEDVGMLLVGGKLNLDLHYNNLGNDKEEPDNSGLELCVVHKDNFRKNTATIAPTLSSLQINLPPHSENVDVTGRCTLSGEEPVHLITSVPHAHRLAKHMKFTLERANGEKLVFHDQSFDFQEQTQFPFKEPLVVNKGDTLVTTCTYDNDSDRAVMFGENTGDEMCFNFAMYYPQGALQCARSQ